MATALDLVTRSMRLIGALGSGETPTAQEEDDGLTALNAMLSTWGNVAGNIYHVTDASYTWTANQETRTLGPSGDLTATRPIRIVQAFQRDSDFDYPIMLIEHDQWYKIGDKATTSDIPWAMWVEYSHPDITLHLHPVPTTAITLHVVSWQALQSFTDGEDVVALPPGYENAIVYNLAIDIAPEYDRPVGDVLHRRATGYLNVLKRQNHRVPSARLDAAWLPASRPGRYRIFGDSFR